MADTLDASLHPVGLDGVEHRLDVASIELAELQQRFLPIKVNEGAIVVQAADPVTDSPKRNSKSILTEIGGTGQSLFSQFIREDYNNELRGHQGLRLYDRMRKSDGQIRGALRVVKTPVLAARWYMEPASNKKKDQTISKFVWDNLNKWMSVSFPQTLNEALLMLDFGYYLFEKVFEVRKGKIIWRKLAPRHPLDVRQWEWDDHGGPKGVWLHQDYSTRPDVFIPIWKLAIFTFDKEAGDVTGIPVLRPMYQHWFYKQNLYKIDAIQKERHGIGIPIIVLPANFDEHDKALADEIGANLRTNERSHLVLPPNWQIMMLKLEGNAVDALKSAQHHNTMIANTILAPFLTDGNAKDNQELFLKTTRFVADTLRDVINKYCIPQLVNWNWPNVDEYPELRVRRIGDTVDWRTISFAIRNFVGSGILIPDDGVEEWVREEMDLPKSDELTMRVQTAPTQVGDQSAVDQAPDPSVVGRPEMPPAGAGPAAPGKTPPPSNGTGRQSSAANMKQTAQGTGKKNTGKDNSGGK